MTSNTNEEYIIKLIHIASSDNSDISANRISWLIVMFVRMMITIVIVMRILRTNDNRLWSSMPFNDQFDTWPIDESIYVPFPDLGHWQNHEIDACYQSRFFNFQATQTHTHTTVAAAPSIPEKIFLKPDKELDTIFAFCRLTPSQIYMEPAAGGANFTSHGRCEGSNETWNMVFFMRLLETQHGSLAIMNFMGILWNYMEFDVFILAL